MYELIEYDGENYPKFQSQGNASQFAIPFAIHFCSGLGVDIGFCKESWKYPGSIGADLNDLSNNYDAFNIPPDLDYVYSSHCLEHLHDWVAAIEYWAKCIKSGGVLFLYLPHPDQKYWKPWNNRKHIHVLYPNDVKDCMQKFGFTNVLMSERDLNHSYIIVGKKK